MPIGLLVIEGTDKGRFFPLPESGQVLIGNNRRKSTICLHDLFLAQIHCQVERMGDQIMIRNVRNTSSTFVNDVAVLEQELQLGDIISIGHTDLRLANEDITHCDMVLPPPDWAASLTGSRLGRFEVGPLVGRGHYGAVFKAHDTRRNRTVALKVISPRFPRGDEEKHRFIRTMNTMLPLRHPNLVALYVAGKNRPFCWLALEYIDGESLAQVIPRLRDSTKINWKRAFKVTVHIARGLHFARQNHVVHRNITPNHILWSNEEKVAKLADLRLSKALEGSRLMRNMMNRKFLAELPYLAPEQADDDGYADDLSDIYSLGAVVYGLLTGRPPFEASSPEDLIEKILHQPPENPTVLQPTIPKEFERVVLNMLAKIPGDRYQTPAELLADLDRIAEEKGINP